MTQPTWLGEPVVSPRLVLRPRREAETDRAAVVELLTDPQVQRYLGGPRSPEDARAALAEPAGQRWGSFLVQLRHGDEGDEGAVVGSCSLSRRRGDLEIGYLFLPRFWGRGLADEAVRAVLAWAGEHLDDDHVVAVAQAANVPSLRLLARLGFGERDRFVEFDAEQVLLSSPLPLPAARSPESLGRG